MASINPNNVCNFIGRLGNDPEVRISPNEKKVVSFSIAVDRRWKEENGEKKSKTNWIRCVAFHPISKLVEACHVKKGNLVHIVGQIENESYIDANTNQRRDTYSIWINGFEKLTGDKKNNAENTTANQQQANASTEEYNEEEDLPF
ncbi:MAG: single-stranded DNA-binding protein [Treponema sp.]|nr:single-stranded DNA-binding protein [Candidatus Treponema caballi]